MGICFASSVQEKAHVRSPSPKESLMIQAVLQQVVEEPEIQQSLELPSKKEVYTGEMGTEPNKTQTIKMKISSEMLVRKYCISEKFMVHYEIIRKLGQGGFGEVYLVKQISTGMVRAVKIIIRKSVQFEEQLLEETEILKTLDHPNIVRVLEIFADFKYYYIVTEYCAGGELLERIKTITNYNQSQTSTYMKQIFSAVLYCHNRKIVHRDLKPENILFDSKDPNANLKLIDFGASEKMIDDKFLTKKIGTPYYVAPEVIGLGYDEKVDVWSCGVILYILLSGRPPFRGRNDYETIKQAKAGVINFPPEKWSKIDPRAINLIKKCLIVDPKLRISILEAFNHPWIQDNGVHIAHPENLLVSLGQFNAESKLRGAICQFISVQIINDKERWLEAFKELDTDGDGSLSPEELLVGVMRMENNELKAKLIVDHVLSQVDMDDSGKIDFTEFISAAMIREHTLSIEKLKQAFKLFDIDDDGQISKDELQQVFGDIEITAWEEILKQFDTNHDGTLNQDEFIQLLQQIKK